MEKQSYQTTKDILLSTPLPEETKTYKPIPHKQVIDLSIDSLVRAGFEIKEEIYSATQDGLIANGRYIIGNVGDSEMVLQVVWQNSYNKKKRLSFSVGARVLVCSNGMIGHRSIGAFRRKHTGEIQQFTPNMIPEYVKQAGDLFGELQKDRDIMKTVMIDKRTTAELVGRAFMEEEFIESTQLNIIKREIEHPTHQYNSPGSLWELYQFVTFAIGGIHPTRWMDDHIAAHKFFTEAAGIIHVEPKIMIPTSPVIAPNQLDLFEDSLIY